MKPVAEPVLEVDGLRLRGRAWPGAVSSAPALLLLHATSFCGAAWMPVWRAACDAGAQACLALAPDARGHGESDAPQGPEAYAWTRLAGDTAAWIDALAEIAPGAGVVLVGHSSGATAALAVAGVRPGRVRGVLAVEPVLYDRPPPGADTDSYPGSRFMASQARRRRARFSSVGEARARLGARAPYAGFAPETLAAVLAGGLAGGPSGEVSLRCTPEVEASCYDGAAALDVWPAIGRISCPVRLLAGERSFMPPVLVARICERLPHADVVTLSAGTHFVALEQPERVGEELARFLGQVTQENDT